MPVSRYYGGQGKAVMSAMKKRYGGSGGERAFYATHNKQNTHKGRQKKAGRSKTTY